MLDRAKLFKEISRVSDELFVSHSDEYEHARQIWNCITKDELFAEKCASQLWPLPIPSWDGPLDAVTTLEHRNAPYTVIGVDGSQIYPDRHQGTSCYLINIGLIAIEYGLASSCVQMITQPYVFTGQHDENFLVSTTDMVNAVREAYEFETGYAYTLQYGLNRDSSLILFDGSLIFWHLESKDASFKHTFIKRYTDTLAALYDNRMLHAAYVSMPRHREVSNLIRLALCNFESTQADIYKTIEHVTDSTVIQFFLAPGQRSTIFGYTGPLRLSYPDFLRPHFFYINTGYEIGRVEIPAWIANNLTACDFLSQVIVDQANKGHGYPIILAEAHEQAVIKGADRDFFYQVITKYALQRKKRIAISPKSMKKRLIGV